MNGLRQSVSHIHVLSQLDDTTLMDIIRTCSLVTYPPGKIIYDLGDPPTALFLIDQGTVRRLQVFPDGSTEVLATLEAGDTLGEMSFLERSPRLCRAVAVSPCRLYRIDGQRFNTLRANFHPSAYRFIRALSGVLTARLRAINEKMRLLQEDPEATIAYLQQRSARRASREVRP